MEVRDAFIKIRNQLSEKTQKTLRAEIEVVEKFLTFAKIRSGNAFVIHNLSTGDERILDLEDAAKFIGLKPHSLRCQLSGLKRPLDRLVNGDHIQISPVKFKSNE